MLFDIGVGHNHDFQVGSPWMYSKNRRLTDEQQGEMLQMLVTCKSSQALRDQVEAMYNIRMNRFDCSNVRRRTMRTNPDLFRQQMKEEPDNDEDDSKRTVSFPPPERTRKRRKLEDPT